MSLCVWFCLVMVCGGMVSCVCFYYYFFNYFFFKPVLHGRKTNIVLPWSWSWAMPWHLARPSPAKISWLGYQRQGPQHIWKQGLARSRDDEMMRAMWLQASWQWFTVAMSSALLFVSISLVFFWIFGEVAVETDVDLAEWTGEINLCPDVGQTDLARFKSGSRRAPRKSSVQPFRLLLKMYLL